MKWVKTLRGDRWTWVQQRDESTAVLVPLEAPEEPQEAVEDLEPEEEPQEAPERSIWWGHKGVLLDFLSMQITAARDALNHLREEEMRPYDDPDVRLERWRLNEWLAHRQHVLEHWEADESEPGPGEPPTRSSS